jgi:hypothetical protein
MTSQRVTNLYDLMDSAWDAHPIHEHSRGLGHIPIIDIHPRRDQALKEELQAEQKRCKLLNYRCAEDLRRVWGAIDPRARPCQSDVPTNVWHPRAGRR